MILLNQQLLMCRWFSKHKLKSYKNKSNALFKSLTFWPKRSECNIKPVTKVPSKRLTPHLNSGDLFKETQPWHAFVRKQDNQRKRAKNRGGKSSTNTDTDTNLWARSKTRLHTRGYKGSEVLVSLSRQSCDHSLRLWPEQMRGHYPSGNHYLLSVFYPDNYRLLQALGPELSYSHCTKHCCLYLAVEIYCN